MEDVIPGLYEHYKGKVYEVIDVGEHTETGEELVIYRSHDPEEKKLWVRPKSMFLENVKVGEVEVPRFKVFEEMF